MAKKIIIASTVLVLSMFLLSVAVADGGLGFNHTVTSGEFDSKAAVFL